MPRQRKVKTLIQSQRPPAVEINGQSYQFKSLLELRFALLLENLRIAGEIEQWQYEPTTLTFPEYKTRPKIYIPDFVTIKGEETTIYEGLAYITPQYAAKFKRLKEMHGDWKVVIVMDKPDSDAKRKCKYARLTEKGTVDHIWYVGKDFQKLGILEVAKNLCDAGQPEQPTRGEQLDLIDVGPANFKAIKPVAKKYRLIVKERLAAQAKEVELKTELLALVKDAHMQHLDDGTIQFRVDGMLITITPRDELIKVKDDEE